MHEEVRVTHLLRGQANFLRSEENCGLAGTQVFANAARALLQALQGVFHFSIPDGAGGDHQRAVGDCIGDALELFSAGENVGCTDCGTGVAKSRRVGIDHT